MSSSYTLTTMNIIKGLAQQWEQGELCDVKLQVQGQSILAHKNVLAAASKYFHSMFLGEFKESKHNVVNIQGITYTGFEIILRAIYSSELELTNKSVEEVLAASDFLQIEEIAGKCEQHMISNLTNATCFTFLKLCENFHMESGVSAANDFIISHFSTITISNEFLEISKEALCAYLDDDMLNIKNEMEAFRAAQIWIEHDKERERCSAEIMRSIRLACIPSEIVNSEIRKIPFIQQNHECLDLLFETLNYQSNIYVQPMYTGSINKPRGRPSLVVIEAGDTVFGKYAVNNYETTMWNIPMDNIHDEPAFIEVPSTFAYDSVSLVTYNNFMFLFGVENTSFSPTSRRYDATTNTWINIEPKPDKATVGSSVVRIGDVIIVAGGMYVEKNSICKIYSAKLTKNVYKYNIASNTWTEGKDLPEPLAYAGSCEFNGMMYVSGGEVCDGSSHVKTDKVWAYDVTSDAWISKPPLPDTFTHHCLAAYRNTMYAFAGRTSDELDAVVAIFSVENDRWQIVDSDSYPLERASYVLHEDVIYIINGAAEDSIDVNILCTLDAGGQVKSCGLYGYDFTLQACAPLYMKYY